MVLGAAVDDASPLLPDGRRGGRRRGLGRGHGRLAPGRAGGRCPPDPRRSSSPWSTCPTSTPASYDGWSRPPARGRSRVRRTTACPATRCCSGATTGPGWPPRRPATPAPATTCAAASVDARRVRRPGHRPGRRPAAAGLDGPADLGLAPRVPRGAELAPGERRPPDTDVRRPVAGRPGPGRPHALEVCDDPGSASPDRRSAGEDAPAAVTAVGRCRRSRGRPRCRPALDRAGCRPPSGSRSRCPPRVVHRQHRWSLRRRHPDASHHLGAQQGLALPRSELDRFRVHVAMLADPPPGHQGRRSRVGSPVGRDAAQPAGVRATG